MKNKKKQKIKSDRLALRAPEGITLREQWIGNTIRWTVPNGDFAKLVGYAVKGQFRWIHSAFSAM